MHSSVSHVNDKEKITVFYDFFEKLVKNDYYIQYQIIKKGCFGLGRDRRKNTIMQSNTSQQKSNKK